MKKLLILIFISTLASIPSFAGGPDVRKLPEIRTFPKAKGMERPDKRMIEPLKDSGKTMEEKNGIKRQNHDETVTRSQPSYGKPEKVVERVIVKEQEVKKKFPILIESTPPSAEVVVNGLYVGSTPVQIPLTDGVYNVRIMLSGHDLWEQQVKAYQGLRVSAILQQGQ
ncbi:MAG: PEGA domain-containing protein [Nitrospinota bacterium]